MRLAILFVMSVVMCGCCTTVSKDKAVMKAFLSGECVGRTLEKNRNKDVELEIHEVLKGCDTQSEIELWRVYSYERKGY